MNFLEIFEELENERSTGPDDRVLIIDGLNTFVRVFATMPSLSDSGEHVGGILGTLRSIGSNIRDFNPTRCIIVFDGKGGSLRRRKLFPDYKQNRTSGGTGLRSDLFENIEEEKQSMRKQMNRVVEYFGHLPVQMLSIDNIEADDTIAYLAMQYFKNKSSKIRIVSTDRDFLQLVCENIEIYSPVKKKLYNVDSLTEEFELHHNNYLVYRALTGDLSDNIPGIKGVGLKTLLKEFPELKDTEINLEYIIEKSNLVIKSEKRPKKFYQSIHESSDELYRNYKLMQLHDVDISLESKQRIISTIEQNITKIDRYRIKNMISEDYLQKSFSNLDQWIDMTFYGLNVWSNK